MSNGKRRASGRPTSECMHDFFMVRFANYKRSDASQLDVQFWLSSLAEHKSVPKKYRITAAALLRYFDTGTITCPYYVFLIRAALEHYYRVLEVNELPSSVKLLAMHILEDRDVITLRSAAEQLKIKPYQLVQVLNGHEPIDQQMEMAIHDLVHRISDADDAIICGSHIDFEELDYLDWDPENGDFYPDEVEVDPEDDDSDPDPDDESDS
jgi:hypothetical protein